MDENQIRRIMPNNLEAEQAVLASMMMDKAAIVAASDVVIADDFYQKIYGVIFQTIVDLYNGGKVVDFVTLSNALREKDVPEEVGSVEYLRDLMMMFMTSADVKQHAKIVHDKAVQRKLITLTTAIANSCYEGKEPLGSVLSFTEKEIFKVLQSQMSGDYEPMADIVLRTVETIEIASRNRSVVTGLSTGFYDLDGKTAGLQKSDLILLAARPSMGKTAMSLNLLEAITVKAKKSAVIFSLEMSKEQLVKRLLAMESRVDSQKLRTGRMEEREWDALVESAGVLAESTLIIDDTPGISIGELRSKCRKYKLEHDIQIVIIDYLQLMKGDGNYGDNRQQEVSDISRSLKALARELDVPVIALSQLSRAPEQRPDHRPMLSDLRESGSIEQDADVVMFLYRDEYYNKDSEKKGIAEVIIAKQRNGPVGTVELAWLPELTRFANLEQPANYQQQQ